MKRNVIAAGLILIGLHVVAGPGHASGPPPPCDPPSIPTLASPPNDSNCQSGTGVRLDWNASSGATAYLVYFGTNCTDPPHRWTVGTTYKDVPDSDLAPATSYCWRINARKFCTGEGYKYSGYSAKWHFTTKPGQASDPSPTGTNVALDADLNWTPGAGAAASNGHDVYFGTDYNDVNDANTSSGVYQGRQSPNTWDSNNYDPNGLTPGQTYCWRIDEIDTNSCIRKGTTWQFTTCFVPGDANDPYPEPNATQAPLEAVLSWTPGPGTPDTNGHDVYFGTDYNDVNDANTSSSRYIGRQDTNSYDPNGLEPNSPYYWRIDQVNDCGTNKGTTWWFTTCALPGQASEPNVQGPNGEPNAIDSVLSWRPGDVAESHVVYFGVDFNDVNNATAGSSQYMGLLDVNNFDTRRKSGFVFADAKLKNIRSLARVSEPNVIYVDRVATGANDGTSWADAYINLQGALGDANSSGKDIWVAEGTYKPTDGNDQTVSFQLVDGVGVYGGFAGTELSLEQRNWRKYQTILTGDINQPGDANDNSYHVVKGADNATIDGFTITAGNANGSSNNNRGGGIFCYGTSPTINHCTIEGNKSSYVGAGMYNTNNSAKLANCVLRDNESSGSGGAIANYSPDCSGTLSNCAFYGNKASSRGGATFNFSSSPALTNCTFTNNEAGGGGGGIANWGLSNPVITNCVFWANTAGINPQIEDMGAANPTVTYSDVQGGYSGTGNIDSDPCFFDANNPVGADGIFGTLDDGLRIAADSNCVEAGDPNTDPNDAGTADVTGYDRFVDGDANGSKLVDMGAYEYNPSPAKYARSWRSEGFGINESATVVGVSYDPNGNGHAFIGIGSEGNEPNAWVSALTDLHPAGDANDSMAYDISDSNWIAGKIGRKAFVIKYPDDMNMTKLKSLFSETDHDSVARAVTDGTDDFGPVAVGWSGGRAVLWYNLDSNEPNIHNLGPVARYHKSKAYNVNQYQQVVGYYYPAFGDTRPDRAFVGSMQDRLRDIGTLGQGNVSRAFGINNAGQVVGEATIDANDTQLRAFIHDGLQMYNLNNLISRDSNDPNWLINSAQSINDDGHVAGYGTCDDSNGLTRALLLIPMHALGHWQFDEGSGITAADSSASGNHGQLQGPTWTGGKIRGALSFDGIDDYVEVDDSGFPPFGQYGSFSIVFWARPIAGGSVLSKYRASDCSDGIFGYEVKWASSEFEFVAEKSCTGQTNVATGSGSAAAYNWFHVTCTYNSKSMKIYLDGQLKDSATFAFDTGGTTPDKALAIGAKSYDSVITSYFKGLIDDVRIYPWALSDVEAEELFEGQNW